MVLSKHAASPLTRLLKAASIRRVDVASRAGCSLQSVDVLCRLDPEEIANVRLSTVARVAAALGCAPAELVPWLAQSPRSGLLWERGLRKRKPARPPG